MPLLSSSRFLQYLNRRHILSSDILKCDALYNLKNYLIIYIFTNKL